MFFDGFCWCCFVCLFGFNMMFAWKLVGLFGFGLLLQNFLGLFVDAVFLLLQIFLGLFVGY